VCVWAFGVYNWGIWEGGVYFRGPSRARNCSSQCESGQIEFEAPAQAEIGPFPKGLNRKALKFVLKLREWGKILSYNQNSSLGSFSLFLSGQEFGCFCLRLMDTT